MSLTTGNLKRKNSFNFKDKFNDFWKQKRLFVRGDSISDALQMIDDFDGQVQNFSQWLYKIEQDLNYLEDYCLKSDDTNSNKQTVIELYQVNFNYNKKFQICQLTKKFKISSIMKRNINLAQRNLTILWLKYLLSLKFLFQIFNNIKFKSIAATS